MERRSFLHIAGAGMASSHLNPFGKKSTSWFDYFVPSNDHVLVIIQLEGGNDGLNTLIPIDQYDVYASIRKSVAIKSSDVLALNNTNKAALHPSYDEIRGLYNEGRIKFIQSVGYPNPNYSHFRSTDIWMSGADADEIIPSGWAGRYLNYEFPNYPNGFPTAAAPDPLSVEIGYGQSLTFQGPTTGMAVTIADPDSFNALIEDIETPLPNTLAGNKQAYLRLIRKQSNLYGDRLKLASKNARNLTSYPNNTLADQLKIVARLIAGGLKTNIYKVSISGFDNHDNQVNEANHSIGTHANLLRTISTSVKAFMDDLEALKVGHRVIGMTVSEFGRRIVSNASRGTDHGAAAPLMVFGNAVQGGILGNTPTIPVNAKVEDNIPMQYDFRSVYGSILEQWFCVNKQDVQKVLTHPYQSLHIIQPKYGCLATPSHDENVKLGKEIIKAYPNPFTSIVNFDIESNGQYAMISIYNPMGQLIANLYQGILSQGAHKIYWNSEDHAVGNYYVRVQMGRDQQVKMISKVQ